VTLFSVLVCHSVAAQEFKRCYKLRSDDVLMLIRRQDEYRYINMSPQVTVVY
jgi:hypothetical protein